MSFNVLMALTRQRIARAGVGLLVLAGAAFAQYKLANVPMPVNLDTTGKFSPATIRLGQEELIVEGPVVNSAEGILFSHDGRPNEIVDVSFEHARLDEQTVGKFQSLGLSPPSTPAKIDYRAQDSRSAPIGDEPCRTRVELRASSKMPDEIHLFQLGNPGLNHDRQLEMRTTGSELTTHLLIESPSGLYLEPGCQKVLKVGDWNRSCSIDITTNVAENSGLRLSFKPLTSDSALWEDTEGLFTPFELGQQKLKSTDPLPFQAQAASIRPLGDGNSSAPLTLSARSTSNGPLLTIHGLRIGSDQIQLSVSGKGFVKIDGGVFTVNFLTRVQENPILSALLAAVNAALLALVARLILKSPLTSP
jgi:hypothetical protein